MLKKCSQLGVNKSVNFGLSDFGRYYPVQCGHVVYSTHNHQHLVVSGGCTCIGDKCVSVCVCRNRLKVLPEPLTGVRSLQKLDISHNRLTKLPTGSEHTSHTLTPSHSHSLIAGYSPCRSLRYSRPRRTVSLHFQPPLPRGVASW